MRIRVGLFEADQAAAVLSTQSDWTKEELQRALLPIFCKRYEQRSLVLTLIDELLTAPSPPPLQPVSNVAPIHYARPITEVDPVTDLSFWRSLQDRLTRLFELLGSPKSMMRLLLMVAVVCLLAALAILLPVDFSVLRDRFQLVIRSLLGAISDPLGTDLTSKGGDPDRLDAALMVRHSIAAALIASAAVAALLTFSLRKRPKTKPPETHDEHLPAETKGDASVFRVGSLGGLPPRFLDPRLATEIVELLSYRETDRDRRILDLRSTIDSRVRGDMDSLIFEKRKELPTVVILTDSRSDARYWNTTATEFQIALERRGLTVETLAYSGTFSETSSDHHGSDTISSALEMIAGGSGWMLTTVFGDLKRLSGRDISLLATLREQGPVLAFDYDDPRLWDRRHEILEGLGIAPHPAAGPALRQALAAAFAPDRAAIRQTELAKPREPAFEHLSEPHAQWASACAMVEPVSFALAEKLRAAQPELAGNSEILAFSLLARLPGSWVGPEGLRFSSQIRRLLLSRSATTPRSQQFSFLQVLDKAFGEEPKSITAAELWRYTRAQAELFTPRQSRAVQDLVDIKAGGLIDESQLNDFIQRLRQPGEAKEAGTIALSLRSSRLLALARSAESADISEKEPPTVSATWSVGLSETRVRLGSEAAPLAAFLGGGSDILLVEPGVADPQLIFSRVDAVRGSRGALGSGGPALSNANLASSDFAELMIFPQTESGVLVTRDGRLFSFPQIGNTRATGTESRPALSLTEVQLGIQTTGVPLVALSLEGYRIACCGAGSSIVVVTSANEDVSPQHISLPGNVSAIAFSQSGGVLCGLENGDVFRMTASPSGFGSPERVASFGLVIAALAETVA